MWAPAPEPGSKASRQVTDTGVALSKGDAYSSAVPTKAGDRVEFSSQVPSKLSEKLPARSLRTYGGQTGHRALLRWGSACSLNEWAGASQGPGIWHGSSEARCLRSRLAELIAV